MAARAHANKRRPLTTATASSALPLLLLLVAAAALVLVTPAHAGALPPPPPPKHNNNDVSAAGALSGSLHETTAFGVEALSLSVDRLDAVAAKYKQFGTAAALRAELKADPDLGVTPAGDLLYACLFGTVNGTSNSSSHDHSHDDVAFGGGAVSVADNIAAAFSSLVPGADPATSEAFRLHSRPRSARAIYLAFLGCTTTNSVWSSGTITTPPYNTDGDASAALTEQELSEVVFIWRFIAEAYASFDVDVTTEEPSVSNFGTRVCLGGSSGDCECLVFVCVCVGVCGGGRSMLGLLRSNIYIIHTTQHHTTQKNQKKPQGCARAAPAPAASRT